MDVFLERAREKARRRELAVRSASSEAFALKHTLSEWDQERIKLPGGVRPSDTLSAKARRLVEEELERVLEEIERLICEPRRT